MVKDILRKMGLDPANRDEEQIEVWRQWYKGEIPSFQNYRMDNGRRRVGKKRATLHAAKQTCEYWASLLWNSDCYITVENDSGAVKYVLDMNDFYPKTTELTERAFALGTAAFAVSERGGFPVIDYIPADGVYPLKNGGAAFVGVYNEGHYIQAHTPIGGEWLVQNAFFDKQGRHIQTAPEDILPEYRTAVKRFALIKPAVVNNFSDSQMGISVYANAIDILKSVDLAFDGANESMMIGRPRIGVTNAMLKSPEFYEMGESNCNQPYRLEPLFDPNDTSVYSMGAAGDNSDVKVQDLTVAYRAREFEESLQNQLTLLSNAVGLGSNAFKWDRNGLSTATQVISENSAMLRTMEKHQGVLNQAIKTVVRAILDILGLDPEQEITVTFDDSITRDKSAERARFWQFVQAGVFPFWKYLVQFEGYGEEEAKEIVQEAQTKNNTE